jgi:hypothetical protein
VDDVSVWAARLLVDYFKSHAKRVYTGLLETRTRTRDELALAWIRKKGGQISVRELLRHHVAGVKTAGEAKALLDRLQVRGLGTIDEGERGNVTFTLA